MAANHLVTKPRMFMPSYHLCKCIYFLYSVD